MPENPYEPPKGRPMKLPKLHLRDLFWLTLVAACLCAWLARERQLAEALEASKLREVTVAEWLARSEPPKDDEFNWGTWKTVRNPKVYSPVGSEVIEVWKGDH